MSSSANTKIVRQFVAASVAAAALSAAAMAQTTGLTPLNDLGTGMYNGFQGGLNWYRVHTGGKTSGELEVFTGRTIDVPATFISGRSDWGIYQTPGAIEKMQKSACTRMKQIHLIEGAGHWVQQEKPDEVNRLLLQFLKST